MHWHHHKTAVLQPGVKHAYLWLPAILHLLQGCRHHVPKLHLRAVPARELQCPGLQLLSARPQPAAASVVQESQRRSDLLPDGAI